jgi:hypothetical protein
MLGLLIILVAAGVVFALPIVAFRRTAALLGEMAELRRTIRRLEAELAAIRQRLERATPPVEQAITPPDHTPSGALAPAAGAPIVTPAAAAVATRVEVLESAEGPLAHERPVEARSALPESESLESRIGSRWMLYVGTAALVLGIGFFVKHAFENQWVTPAARVLIGAVAGLALVILGARFLRAGYALYGQILTGGGIATLYVSDYAAFNFYDLLSRPAAFALMVIVTATAAVLSDRQRSAGLALTAVSGGFLTPFLISSGQDAQVALFTYDAILVAATMYLAHRRNWPALNVMSFVLTVVTFASWAMRYYTPGRYLSTELFLTLFCAMFLFILHESRRSPDRLGVVATEVLSVGPLLYHAASLLVLFGHGTALLVYLIAFSAASIILSVQRRRAVLRSVLWAAAILPFFAWLGSHTGPAWTWPAAATLCAMYGMHLMAQRREVEGAEGDLPPAEVVLFHLNGLALFGGAYMLLDARAPDWDGPLAAGLALWNLAVAAGVRRTRGDALYHPLALAFALAATAIALQFQGLWITALWAAEGAALVFVGLKARRDWLRAGGALLLGIAAARFLILDEAGIPATFTPVFNPRFLTGLFIVGLLYVLAILHRRMASDTAGGRKPEIILSLAGANLLTLVIATIEIHAYFAVAVDTFEGRLARELVATVVWGVYGATLVALGGTRPCDAAGRSRVRAAGAGLLGLAVLRFVSADLAGDPAGILAFLNTRFAVGVLLIALLYGLASLERRTATTGESPALASLLVAANVLTLVAGTVEINTFWRVTGVSEAGKNAFLAQQLTISVTWALYAVMLVAIGIRRRYPPIRYLAIALFALTVAKVFVVDLSELAGIYRVSGFVVLGSVLLVASYLYQRYRARLA